MAHQRLLHRFIPVWTEAPMLRLLLPLVSGILLQWYLPVSFGMILLAAVAPCSRYSATMVPAGSVLDAAIYWCYFPEPHRVLLPVAKKAFSI